MEQYRSVEKAELYGPALERNRCHRTIRRIALSAVMLILFSSAAIAEDRKNGETGFVQPLVENARLLLDSDYFGALLKGIAGAQNEICISSYLFRTIGNADGCPETVLKELFEAVRRGVLVKVILERRRKADDLDRNNLETAGRLKAGGICVCMDAPNRVTHTKLVVIDRRYLLIGSHNLTQSALKYNHEASVWIDSVPLAEEALHYMESLCSGIWR